MRNRALILMGIVLCLGLSLGHGQETPVLPEKVWRALANELSGDIAFDYVRHLTFFHATDGGSEGFRLEAEWVAEKAGGSLVPEWIVSLADSLKMLGYTPFWRFGSLGGEGLHPHYVNEVFNLVDGKRTVLEIYRTVRATALSAGEWYYGPANFVHVKEVLERVAKTGAIRLNQLPR